MTWITLGIISRWMPPRGCGYGVVMAEETLYPVCPHRNVPAAFACFLGPDARGLDRFFDPGALEEIACRLFNVMDAGSELVAGIVTFGKHALLARPERATPLFDFRFEFGDGARII